MFKKLVVILGLVFFIGVGFNSLCYAQGKKWAVVIGISNYKKADWNLRYPAEEAKKIMERILQGGDIIEATYDEVIPSDDNRGRLRCLINDKATKAAIESVFTNWLPNYIGENDALFIYFSGHGSQDRDMEPIDEGDSQDEYIMPYDAELSRDDKINIATMIRDDIFGNWINNLRCKLITMMFDCCYGGGTAKEGKSVGPVFRGTLSDEFLKDIKKEGTFVLAACKANQKARDGKFTPAFLKIFSGTRPNLPDRELLQSLISEVSKMTANRQTPMIIDNAKNEPKPLSTFFPGQQIIITYPTDRQKVDYISDVRGITTGIAPGTKIYLKVLTDRWYPQTSYGTVKGDGSWIVEECYFGRQGMDEGLRCSVKALIKNNKGYTVLESNSVKVVRE